VPVRIWHWVMVPAMLVLFVTGYFIGAPLPSVGGEASENFSSATSASPTSRRPTSLR
jgi:Ni,Fe-hydrogenase I cytochrome b subunit